MKPTWRLILDPSASGSWNMSVDEALLLHCSEAGPTLRLYTWEARTLSLGYRQGADPWASRCRELGVASVRRVSGGGAVLHGLDLTYSVVAPAGCPDLPSGLEGSYGWIRSVLLRGLERAGVRAAPARATPGAAGLPVCFAGSLGVEIELEGRKLVGSAQRRMPDGLLQHGSIRLGNDSDLYRAIFDRSVAPPPVATAQHAPAAIVSRLVETFCDELGGRLKPGVLTLAERTTASSRAGQRRADPLLAPALFSSSPISSADTSA